jgi:hypothetical protein
MTGVRPVVYEIFAVYYYVYLSDRKLGASLTPKVRTTIGGSEIRHDTTCYGHSPNT